MFPINGVITTSQTNNPQERILMMLPLTAREAAQQSLHLSVQITKREAYTYMMTCEGNNRTQSIQTCVLTRVTHHVPCESQSSLMVHQGLGVVLRWKEPIHFFEDKVLRVGQCIVESCWGLKCNRKPGAP